MAATILLLLYFLRGAGYAADRRCIFYIASLILLSMSKFTTASYPLQWMDTLFIAIMLAALVLEYSIRSAGQSFRADIAGMLAVMFRPVIFFARPFEDAADYLKNLSNRKTIHKKGVSKDIIIGIVTAVPVIIVVTALLGDADAVFAKVVSDIINNIRISENAWDIIGIIFMISAVFIASYCICCMIGTKHTAGHKTEIKSNKTLSAVTFTGMLTSVYLVFSVIQIVYLFIGNMTLPDGETYAEYAHEGFYQLVIVCLINLAVVMAVRDHFEKRCVLTVILCIFSVCTYIMMSSAVIRMAMYVESYGLTFLRLFVLWFIALMFIWFTALMISLFIDGCDIFKFFITSATVMYLIFALAHPDYWIARYDIAKYKDAAGTLSGDCSYVVYHLSEDAVPAIISDRDLAGQRKEFLNNYRKDSSDLRKLNISVLVAEHMLDSIDGQ